MNKQIRGIGFYLIVFLALILVVSYLYKGEPGQTAPIYSDIVGYFEKEQVESFTLDSDILKLKLRGQDAAIEYRLMSLDLFMYDVGDLIKEQRAAGKLSMDYIPPPKTQWWMSMVPYIIILLVFGFLWFYVINNATGAAGGGKMAAFGKARTKVGSEEKKKVTFKDVAGADEEKEELEEIVDFLKEPVKFVKLGARIPKGVLLIGPPGTGKTLLAKAVAGEAGVPFLSISGSDFVEMFVGVGASRVRDLFDQAKKNSPSIVFIDEIDAVGRQRGAGLGGGHDEREQTLNQLLVEMDGFGANEGVIVMAATNRSDILDPALTRAGRFDRQVYVGVPDIKGREEILKVHSVNKPLAPEVNLGTIAKETIGFTGADLENLLNEAALLSARRDKKQIEMPEIEEAAIKVMVGPEKKSRVTSPKEKMLTSYHEAGHAVVTRLLKTQDPVHQISIIPRGQAGGYTLSLPKEDKYYRSKNEMFESIIVLLGGRVAEKLTLEDISTGASNDLERASRIARAMVTKYGMSDKIGPVVFGSAHDEVFIGRDLVNSKSYSESMAAEIDNEVKKMVDQAYTKCEEILKENIACLHEIAKTLFDVEKMDGSAFEEIMQRSSPRLIRQRKEKEEKKALEGESEEKALDSEEGEKKQIIAPPIDEGEEVIGPDIKDTK